MVSRQIVLRKRRLETRWGRRERRTGEAGDREN